MASVREVKGASGNESAEAAGPLNDSVDSARDELRRLKAKLRANGVQLEDELRDATERMSDGAKKLGAAAAEQIREHPLAAFGVAFAAGIVASRLLRRR